MKSPKNINKLLPNQLTRSQVINLLVAAIIVIISSWLMFHTFKYQDNQMIIASKVWSDFGAHIPLIRSFTHGNNFPQVEYPTFPGEPIRYHFLFYFLAAQLESIGFSITTALNLISVVGFSLLLWMIYRLTTEMYSRKIAGITAIVLFLFNGTLGFIEFFRQNPPNVNTLKDITSAVHFVNFGPWDGNLVSAFWNLNIYTNQRHLSLSFAIGLLILYPYIKILFHQKVPKKSLLGLTIVLMLILPWLHQAAVFLVLIVAGALVILDFRRLKLYLPFFISHLLAALPGIALTPMNSNLAFQPGFLSPEKTLVSTLQYWVYNLGLYLLLIPILFIWGNKPTKKLLLAILPLFFLANLFRLSPDMINNHKLINFFMLFIIMITAAFLVHLIYKRTALKVVAVLLFVCLTLSGFIDIFPIINDHYLHVNDVAKDQTAKWIYLNTPKNSVFLTTTYLYNPASLAGRKTFVDYGYFNWSMGYDDYPRRQLLPQIFNQNIDTSSLCQILKSQNINYILTTPDGGDLHHLNIDQSQIIKTFIPAYTSLQEQVVYDVTANCH